MNWKLIIVECMIKFIWQHNLPVGSYHTFKMPPGRLDFWCSKGKKWDPPVTPKLKVREESQSGFCNISSHPTSVPSFSQIGRLQLLAPRTLSQTMTLKWRLERYLLLTEPIFEQYVYHKQRAKGNFNIVLVGKWGISYLKVASIWKPEDLLWQQPVSSRNANWTFA